MSQNSEQIEAKLCAYLEGELDDAGRAEIEKHLQQNPPHRKLLAEMGKTRDLLRALPREPAPPDICEAFQGQLERSVLLADLDDEGATASMKINRWRQYLAVAAVVMLAAGLGLVVYFGLPSGTDDRDYVVGGGGGASGAGGVTEDGAAARSIAPPSDTPSAARQPAESMVDLSPDTGRDAAATQNGQPGLPDQLAKRSVSEAVPSMQAPAASAPAAAPREELDVLARRVQGSWQAKERERLFSPVGGAEAQATLKALEDVHASALCYVVMSARDAAKVLGVSHQRVHQLAQDNDE